MRSFVAACLSGSLLLASTAAQALPAGGTTPEKAAENFCAVYGKPLPLDAILLEAFGLQVSPEHGRDLTKNLRDSFVIHSAKLDACCSNLKNIGTALEMYSTDNDGRYPSDLKALTPDYLKTIMPCPAAGKDTYSSTYKFTASPDSYSFRCDGDHHAKVGIASGLPSYNSEVGLTGGAWDQTKMAKRDCRVKSITKTDATAVAVIEETVSANIDSPPVTTETQAEFVLRDGVWIFSQAIIADETSEQLLDLFTVNLLELMDVAASDPVYNLSDEGSKAFAALTPLQKASFVAKYESQPVAYLFMNQEQLLSAFNRACYGMNTIAMYSRQFRAQENRWPSSLDELFKSRGTEVPEAPRAFRLETSSDGSTFTVHPPEDLNLSGFGLQKGYPKVRVTANSAVQTVYRP